MRIVNDLNDKPLGSLAVGCALALSHLGPSLLVWRVQPLSACLPACVPALRLRRQPRVCVYHLSGLLSVLRSCSFIRLGRLFFVLVLSRFRHLSLTLLHCLGLLGGQNLRSLCTA